MNSLCNNIIDNTIEIDNITEQSSISLDEEGHAEIGVKISKSNDFSLNSNSFINNLGSTKSPIVMGEYTFTQISLNGCASKNMKNHGLLDDNYFPLVRSNSIHSDRNIDSDDGSDIPIKGSEGNLNTGYSSSSYCCAAPKLDSPIVYKSHIDLFDDNFFPTVIVKSHSFDAAEDLIERKKSYGGYPSLVASSLTDEDNEDDEMLSQYSLSSY